MMGKFKLRAIQVETTADLWSSSYYSMQVDSSKPEIQRTVSAHLITWSNGGTSEGWNHTCLLSS